MNSWQNLKEAERLAKAEEERLCQLYDCYAWEIDTERKKEKNRKKEILPYLFKHIENGIEVSDDTIRDLFLEHKVVEENTEGELDIFLEDLSADVLEELLQLYIKEKDKKKLKSAAGQRM